MEFWLDAQLSPAFRNWLIAEFEVNCLTVKYLGLRDASDDEIFRAARLADNVVVITKDYDFVRLFSRFGPPPKVIWLHFGNTSNERLKEIFNQHFSAILRLLDEGADFLEMRD